MSGSVHVPHGLNNEFRRIRKHQIERKRVVMRPIRHGRECGRSRIHSGDDPAAVTHACSRTPALSCRRDRVHLGSGSDQAGPSDAPLPFWAFAWAGGLAIARYLLDHPELVAGKRVLDIATGSGLCAIAACKAGAASVMAADIDPLSLVAVETERRSEQRQCDRFRAAICWQRRRPMLI